ncbi:MAG: glycosyltransferase family 2 protein [bacterium]|nr:glycosyltransferase family 2 protein [bacterium]
MITFVLPVFNEEGNLDELYEKLTAVLAGLDENYELLFVDDGSSDESPRVLAELQRRDERVRVIEFRRNFGKAAAYSAGFEDARGEIVVTLDTDLQDDPAEVPLFLDKIDEGFDMVVGWKYEGKGNLEKSLPSKFFNSVVRRITEIPLHDFNCPFKAYRKEVLDEIHVYGELHRYIPVLAHARGFTLSEIKIKNLPRKSGTSKFGYERYLRGMLDLLTISFITRFARRPMHLLGMGGILGCLFGSSVLLFFILAHFLYKLNVLADSSWVIHDRPALNLGILLIVVGVQFFSIGLLGELLISSARRGPDDRVYSIKHRRGPRAQPLPHETTEREKTSPPGH